MSKPKPKTVELVKSTYQPTKRELADGAAANLRKWDGSTPSMEEVAGALLDTVNVRLIDKPRNRRR
jgi:hypothetical protein